MEPRIALLTLSVATLLGSAQPGGFPTSLPIEELLKTSRGLSLPSGEEDPMAWWGNLESVGRVAMDQVINILLPIVMDVSKNADVSPECLSSVPIIVSALRRLKPWAMNLLDAFGKPVPGILQGTLTFFGDLKQCLGVTSYKRDGNETFRGQYCYVRLAPALPIKTSYVPSSKPLKELKNFTRNRETILRDFSTKAAVLYTIPIQFDVCVPSICSAKDIENALLYVLEDFRISVSVPYCKVRETYSIQVHQVIIICMFAMLFVLIVSGTAIDIARNYNADNKSLMQRTETYGAKLLRAFSVIYNLRMLFHTDTTHKRLACMHGVRLLSMCWIIFATSYFGFNHRILSNLQELEKIGQYFIFQFIFNSSVAVDSFFFLSGVMLTYITLGSVKKNRGKFNILSYMIKRLWRVTPTIIFFIGGYMLLGDHRVGGPMWHETMEKDVENCKRSWYTNLLYVSNLVLWPKDYCLYDSWYFSCDMQLHFIALIVIYVIFKWPTLGHLFNGILIALSVFANGYITYKHNFPPVPLLSFTDNDLNQDYDAYLYHQPWCHLGVYCIGVWAGYFLHTRPKFRLSRQQLTLGWIVIMVGSTALIHATYLWNNIEAALPTRTESVVYACLYRPSWAIILAFIILTCVYGQGGIVNRFLSWKAFIPFGRLTFMVFLMQTSVRYLLNGILQEQIPVSHVTAVFLFFTILVNVYFMSFFFHLLIDAPVFTLRRLVLQKQKLERTISQFSASFSMGGQTPEINNTTTGFSLKAEGPGLPS